MVKDRKFTELDDADLQSLFAPQEHGGGEEKLCAICHREHPGTEREDEDKPAKCPVCRGFEALGHDLRRAKYLCLDQIEATPLPDKTAPAGVWQTMLAHLGYQAKFCPHLQAVPDMSSSIIRRTLLALADKGLHDLQPGSRQVVGRHFLVNVTPILTQAEHDDFADDIDDLPPVDSVKPFEVMARQSQGIKRLGVLRMDVDNLGQIMSQGLGQKATLSRVATLSFALSLFFEGWVEQIALALNQAAEQDLIYSIYSGGDDLFFVGAWHLMPLLAERFSQDLAKYIGQHPHLHLSGGIALAPK
jgi:CRISPR-associated protein Csm1